MSFNEWTAKEAAAAIPDQTAEWFKMNLAFAAGDHWQNGNAWIGPMLASNNEGYATMLDNIQRTFVPQNAIGEITGRHVAGVIGENPQKHKELKRPLDEGAEPTEAEAALLAEAGALLSTWWNSKQGVVTRNGRISRVSPQEVFQEATRAMLLTRRGPLRFIIPANLLSVDEDGRSRINIRSEQSGANALADVLEKIHLQHAHPRQATVATDGGSMDQAGVYTYKKDEQAAAEICFVDDEGDTVIRLVQAEVEKAVDYPLKLGGRLTMYEMERPLFIDETKRRLQKSLNLARTSESRNIVDGGFLERLYLNTQMPGTWSTDSDTGLQTFTPAKINLGPNTANFLQGLPIRDEQGQITGYTDPKAVFRDPTPADVFVNTAEDLYIALLHEASQLHVLAQGGDNGVSGEFIVQARSDFETSLKQTKTALDAALTWCFDTVLTLAAAIAGDPTHFDALKISGSAIVNSGPLSIGERTAIISAYEKGLLSKETAVRMLGVENTSAELERIEGEEAARLDRLKRQAEIMEILGRAAVALPAAVQTVQDGEISDVTIRGDFVPEGNGQPGGD